MGIFAFYKTVTDNDSTLFIFRTMAYEQPRPRAQTATEGKGKGQALDAQFQTTLAGRLHPTGEPGAYVWTFKRYWCSLSFPYWRCLSPFVRRLEPDGDN